MMPLFLQNLSKHDIVGSAKGELEWMFICDKVSSSPQQLALFKSCLCHYNDE